MWLRIFRTIKGQPALPPSDSSIKATRGYRTRGREPLVTEAEPIAEAIVVAIDDRCTRHGVHGLEDVCRS